jgi:hypothetical protein
MANIPTTCFNLFPYTTPLFCHNNNNNNTSSSSSPRTSPVSSSREINLTRSSFSIDSILGFGGGTSSGATSGGSFAPKNGIGSGGGCIVEGKSRSNSCSPSSPPSPHNHHHHIHNNNNNSRVGTVTNKISVTNSGGGSGGTICGGMSNSNNGSGSSPTSTGNHQHHQHHYNPFPFLHHPAFHIHNQQAAAEILGKLSEVFFYY